MEAANMDVETSGSAAASGTALMDNCITLVARLGDANDEQACKKTVIEVRNSVIGSTKVKHAVVEAGIVPKLAAIISDTRFGTDLKVSAVYTLGSIAKGFDVHCKRLIDAGVVNLMADRLWAEDKRLVESCLCCLRTLFLHPEAPVDIIFCGKGFLEQLLRVMDQSPVNQISVATIFMHSCKTSGQRTYLADRGIISAMQGLLHSPLEDVQIPALQCLATLIYSCETVARRVFDGTDAPKPAVMEDSSDPVDSVAQRLQRHDHLDCDGGLGDDDDEVRMAQGADHHQGDSMQSVDGAAATIEEAAAMEGVAGRTPLLDRILEMMDRDKCVETQLAAARCITYLYRCGVLDGNDFRVIYKALPTVVRLTQKEEATVENRIVAAETLAYLIEMDDSLQRIAAISNHLIPSMAALLHLETATTALAQVHHALPLEAAMHTHNTSASMDSYQMLSIARRSDQQVLLGRNMKKAAFRVFASLGANDEEIRKRIVGTENLMQIIVKCLDTESDSELQISAIKCLHSLSRSVQILRTSFQDHPVWRPLMHMLQAPATPIKTLIVASSALCNLLLEFSPSKEPILDYGAIQMLCLLTRHPEPELRLNGVWGLMNMAFQAEQSVKIKIMSELGEDQIFLLLSDSEHNTVLKTLGLLRNMLFKSHIDAIMALHGTQIMQAVVLILESEHSAEVKEQALCILGNVADGLQAKQFIMSNEDVLKKITSYLMHPSTRLQIAAVICIQNLVWMEEEGAPDRQKKLRDLGVCKILHQLTNTRDTGLYENHLRKCTEYEFFYLPLLEFLDANHFGTHMNSVVLRQLAAQCLNHYHKNYKRHMEAALASRRRRATAIQNQEPGWEVIAAEEVDEFVYEGYPDSYYISVENSPAHARLREGSRTPSPLPPMEGSYRIR